MLLIFVRRHYRARSLYIKLLGRPGAQKKNKMQIRNICFKKYKYMYTTNRLYKYIYTRKVTVTAQQYFLLRNFPFSTFSINKYLYLL